MRSRTGKLRPRFIWLLAAGAAALHAAESVPSQDPRLVANRAWYQSLPSAPPATLTKHGLKADELVRWPVRGANQGVAVDREFFYGIGNFVVVKHRKDNGERVAEWVGLKGGPTVHLNGGLIQEGKLVLSHSNFPQLPMASSLEIFDPVTVKPVQSVSLGIRHGSLTWAERRDGSWWACFAHYNDQGTAPGLDNRYTVVGRFDDRWQVQESWLFPPQIVQRWGKSSCSGGSWGADGLLYVSGHDATELYVLRLPRMGVTLEYVTTIDVPFEGQSWAWDPKAPRIIYGIIRQTAEVVVARIPEVPAALRQN